MIHVRMVFLESIPSAFLSSLDLLNVLGIDPPQDARKRAREKSYCLLCTPEEWIPCFQKTEHHFTPSLLQ